MSEQNHTSPDPSMDASGELDDLETRAMELVQELLTSHGANLRSLKPARHLVPRRKAFFDAVAELLDVTARPESTQARLDVRGAVVVARMVELLKEHDAATEDIDKGREPAWRPAGR